MSPDDFWRGQTQPLPGQDQPLVGRDEHATALRNVLEPENAPDAPRIVVISGAPGIGKTRLAVDVSSQVAPTLVARAGVAVTTSDLGEVPQNAPAIVVVDDARYESTLSGVAALIGDPLYAQVKIVFTLRSSIARQVLADAGLGTAKPVTITLDRLADTEIDQIILNHQISSDEFRLNVARIAAGNPLLAHTACDLALRKGTYHWRDSSELLRDLFEGRLAQIPGETPAHRAVAVALAVMTRAHGGEHLAVLAGAITALPSEHDRLDTLLDDLVQAGIADEPPYALRPDAIGPVVVASAMTGAGVKIKVDRVLNALGGIGLGTDAETLPSNVNTTVFATQLSVLAQAADQADNRGCLGVLHRAVRDLVELEKPIDIWLDVLILASQIAPFSPQLVNELRDLLISQWPLAPGESGWSEDPEQRYRFDVERLLRQAATLADQAGLADAERAVRWALDVAWLAHPVLPRPSVEFAQRAVSSLVKARLPASEEGWDGVFARRDQVLQAVLRWGRERRASAPAGMASEEQDVRHPVVAEEVLFAALRPFLTVVTEDHLRGVPGDASVMVWSHHALPDDLRTGRMLATATDAVAELIERLDPTDPRSRHLLDEIARLPLRLRGEGARGLSGTGPLPDYAVLALATAADGVGAALARRWTELPVMVRHAAAEHAVRPAGRPAATLSALAALGDPIAAAAVMDRALEQLLILLPLNEHLSPRGLDDAEAQRAEQQRRRAAEQLGEQLSTEDALALLDTIDSSSAGSFGHDCLGWFATAAGRNTADIDTVLDRLAAGHIIAGVELLRGLLQSHPERVTTWLTSELANLQIASLAMAVMYDLPAEREAEILDSVLALTNGRTHDTGDDSTLGGAAPSADELSSRDAELGYLALQLAWPIARARQSGRWRLSRLSTLGTDGPIDSVPAALAAIGSILPTTLADSSSAPGDSALREQLVAVLRRALVASDQDPYAPVGYDVATGTVALAVAAPAEVAELLTRRVLADVDRVLPSDCEELLYSADANQREPVALAFQDRLDGQREARALTDRMETAALRVSSQLGAGADGWLQIVRRLSTGSADDRVRAANLIKNSWRHPAWAEIVAGLIDAGLDELGIAAVRDGLALDGIGADLDDQLAVRTEALQPLLSDSRTVVKGFAAETVQYINAYRDYC